MLFDDINGWQRLPIVSSAYYRGALGEMSGLLSMAYHLDHIHRQPWIGFHSWRATARGVSGGTLNARRLLDCYEHTKQQKP